MGQEAVQPEDGSIDKHEERIDQKLTVAQGVMEHLDAAEEIIHRHTTGRVQGMMHPWLSGLHCVIIRTILA